MKGFGIEIKNDLLERKHWEQMGVSIWLFLWLLDKVTSVSEKGVGLVLGGTPVKHELVFAEMGIPWATYKRYVHTLREAGYITTKRTPQGTIFRVNKAKKKFKDRRIKSDLSEIEEIVEKSDGSKMDSDGSKVIPQKLENDPSIYNVIDTTVDITKTKENKQRKITKDLEFDDEQVARWREKFSYLLTKDIWQEIEGARDYIAASGKTYKDYTAFMQNWLRRTNKRAEEKYGTNQSYYQDRSRKAPSDGWQRAA